MTSERQIAANRRNARRSRGPRTPAGRRRISRNAFSHGLAVSVLKEPAVSAEIERLARVLAGTDVDGPLLRHARRITEAEFDLKRIAKAKAAIINAQLAGSKSIGPADAIGAAMVNVLPQLITMHRYESRARSRHAHAFRLFVAHKAAREPSPRLPM
jgi:hypothetical protein